jgi:hypothetical protein
MVKAIHTALDARRQRIVVSQSAVGTVKWAGILLRSARYQILVENPDGAGRGIASAQLDDTVIVERPLRVPLTDDGITHHLRVRLG